MDGKHRIAEVSRDGEVLSVGGYLSEQDATVVCEALETLPEREDGRRVAFLPSGHERFRG